MKPTPGTTWTEEQRTHEQWLDAQWRNVNITTTAFHLVMNNWLSIDDVRQMSDEDLLAIDGMGKGSVASIRQAVG